MDFDSDNLLGELEDYLDTFPKSNSDTNPKPNPTIPPLSSPVAPNTTMTAATKAALGEHLRSHLGNANAAEKRKLDEATTDMPTNKNQKLEDEFVTTLLETNEGGNNASESTPLLAQALMDKRSYKYPGQNNSFDPGMNNQGFAKQHNPGMNNGYQEEDVAILAKINNILKNIPGQQKYAELNKLVTSNPRAYKVLQRYKQQRKDNGFPDADNGQMNKVPMTNNINRMNGNNMNVMNGDLRNNGQWVGGNAINQMKMQSGQTRGNYVNNGYYQQPQLQMMGDSGNMFSGNMGNMNPMEGGMWNGTDMGGMQRVNMPVQGPPPYPYNPPRGSPRMRMPMQQPQNLEGYPGPPQAPHGDYMSQRMMLPNEYSQQQQQQQRFHPQMMPGMSPMRPFMHEYPAAAECNQIPPNRAVAMGMQSPPRSQQRPPIMKVAAPQHMSPGYYNDMSYQQQMHLSSSSDQISSCTNSFSQGDVHRMTGGITSTISTSQYNNYGNNMQQQQTGMNDMMSNNYRYPVSSTSSSSSHQQSGFNDEANRLMLEVDQFSWKASMEGQSHRTQLRNRLQEAVQGNQSLLEEALRVETEAFNNASTQEAYSYSIAEWLASFFDRMANQQQSEINNNSNDSAQETDDNDLGLDLNEDSKCSKASPSAVSDSPKLRPLLSEKNPILSGLLPKTPTDDSVVQPPSSSMSSPTSPPSSPAISLASSSSTTTTSSSTKDNFQSFAAPLNSNVEETKSPPPSSNTAALIQRGSRRPSGKGNNNNPYSVDSGFGSPRSNTSTSLCSPKIHGTSPSLLQSSEGCSPEK